MTISMYYRTMLGLMLGILANTHINAQNQPSNEELIALAKKKQAKIKAVDYIKFLENFLDSTKDMYIKYRIKWHQDNKESARQDHNAIFKSVHKNPDIAQQYKVDSNISLAAWQAKFDKDWNPQALAEDEFKEAKAGMQGGEREYMIKVANEVGIPKMIEQDFKTDWLQDDPREPIFRQQMKQWLDKY